jgi:adenosylmethionine-8-amino-7-oxononanoate aminotransferase
MPQPIVRRRHRAAWHNAGMPGAFLHPFAKPTRERFITIARGEGALLWDADGNELVDAMASLWYCQVGHGRTEIGDAVARQISTIEAYSCFDPFTNAPADALAERIADLTPIHDARVFFAGSGSEAVDSAMKLARLAHVQAGHPERRLIISRVRGYHGTNYGGTSAQGLPLNKQGYGELLADVVQVPSDDIEALSVLMAEHADTLCAVITEPVQGAAGVYPPVDGYLAEARRLCDQHGALLIFDEVITGFGRMGTWFAADYYDVTPDMTTFAKGVTSGYQPLGGVIVGTRVREALEADPTFMLRHGYTYSGHPTACAAALANIGIIEREGLLHEVVRLGARLEIGLRALEADGAVDHVRGDVAIFGAHLHEPDDAMAVRDRMLELGVITRAIGTETVTFCPPFVTTDAQVDRIVDAFATALATSPRASMGA